MRRRTGLAACCVVAGGLAGGVFAATDLTICVDVPSSLSATKFLASQTIEKDSAGVYKLAADLSALGDAIHLDAVYLMTNGGFLFSTDAPFKQGGVDYEAYDVALYVLGPSYSKYFSGSSIGLTRGMDIDAVAIDKAGDLLLSLTTPAKLVGIDFQPADVMRVSGGVLSSVKAFDGAAAGLGSTVNLNGAEVSDDGDVFFTLDVPLAVSGTSHEPGAIFRYRATSGITIYYEDMAFPKGTNLTDFSFQVSPGAVPDGNLVPGTPLKVTKAGGGQITLAWGVACTNAVKQADYSVYEGTIGSFYSHNTAKVCSTGVGVTTATFTPGASGQYYLVVPRNADAEGSYGKDSTGASRPRSSAPCANLQMVRPCP